MRLLDHMQDIAGNFGEAKTFDKVYIEWHTTSLHLTPTLIRPVHTMGLVDYSDSEGSDTETISTAKQALTKLKTTSTTKPAFQKLTNPSESRRIKVDLPTLQEGATESSTEEPPVKKVRTAGAFSGFNSLLPAPKRAAAASNAPKAGVSLRTSGEAAFSRRPAAETDDAGDVGADGGVDFEPSSNGNYAGSAVPTPGADTGESEVKVIGKATNFKPLSVSNKKKSTPKKAKNAESTSKAASPSSAAVPQTQSKPASVIVEPAPPSAKPKRSLFSVQLEDQDLPDLSAPADDDVLQSDRAESGVTDPILNEAPSFTQAAASSNIGPNSLQSLATDLNLTPAQQRQIFGRRGKDGPINITHFDTSAEYAANEALRQAGEVVEHRAVKAIAPGKHSLQQLVNNARSQREGLEDKWAEGRVARGGVHGRG